MDMKKEDMKQVEKVLDTEQVASHLLSKMQESGLISEEEREKINVLNIETFSPELAKVYL